MDKEFFNSIPRSVGAWLAVPHPRKSLPQNYDRTCTGITKYVIFRLPNGETIAGLVAVLS